MKNSFSFILPLLIGLLFWFLPIPDGISLNGWKLFAIFVATMTAVVLRPFPMGAIALFSLAICLLTNVLTFEEAFSGFSNNIVWLIVFAFFVARGFISTGLGNRLAFNIMKILGKNSLGLGYGLIATDFILSPAIPSVTARVGGIIYPMVKALAEVFTGRSHDPKMGGFLSIVAFQGSAITSAMFLTAMAGNPLIAELAAAQGVEITWASWATAALVPGLISLAVLPFFLFWLISPAIKQTPHAKEMAKERLKAMGPIKTSEWIMLVTFLVLITLWIIGPKIGLNPSTAALIGVSILLATKILKWRDIIEETGAWDTFIWFSTFVTLSHFLNQFGLTSWFSHWVVTHLHGAEWTLGLILVSLIYFYTHYFFASSVAHIGAMYTPLAIVAIGLGSPPELVILILAFFSNLYTGLTHYGSGAAPILFGTGYVSVPTWWKIGFLVSLVNIFIWALFGGIWWKILGLW